MTYSETELAILWRLGEQGKRIPTSLTAELVRAGFTAEKVRTAYAKLLDRGVIIADHKLWLRLAPKTTL